MASHAELDLLLKEAVALAFQAHVQSLFKVMMSSLLSGDTEASCRQRYEAGIDLGKRAYGLAFDKVGEKL